MINGTGPNIDSLTTFYNDYFKNIGNLDALYKFRDDSQIDEDTIVQIFKQTVLRCKMLQPAVLLIQASQCRLLPVHLPKELINTIIYMAAQFHFKEEWDILTGPDHYTRFNDILEIKRIEKAVSLESNEQKKLEMKNKIENLKKEIDLQYLWI